MSTSRRHEEGMALLLALFAIIVIAAAVALVMGSVYNAKRSTDHSVHMVQLEEACKAGVNIGIEQVWNAYRVGLGNTTGNLASYRVFIDNVVPNNEDINGNGIQDANELDWDGDGQFEINDPEDLIASDDPRLLDSGAMITGLTVARTDDVTGTTLTLTATAEIGGRTRTATQTMRVAGQRFAGFQFAVLANNINCILCHAHFDNWYQQANTDPDDYNTFDRIKVAALDSLLIRKDENDSQVAGSVYTRGRVYHKDGTELNASGIANSTFDSYTFSPDNGKLTEDEATGELSLTDFANAPLDDEGLPEQFANLYLDYPTDEASMTDGELPLNFPAPFPDENENRYCDQEEFDLYVNSADGYINFELPPEQAGGSITQGVAYGVPDGATYDETALPTESNSALSDLAATGAYDGNLILVGTEYDPITINNKVAVSGDLILKGPIKGRGQLLVKGNVYVVGDVTYADAAGEFGVADDGTENAFALHAGGSILLGDYTTIRAKNNYKDGHPDYVDPYVWQGKFIRVDEAHTAQRMSNGEYTDTGYFDDGVVDAGMAQGEEGQYSFTTSELMLFNRMERVRWAPPGHVDHNPQYYQPGYTPRYYRLRDGAPIYQYVESMVTDSALKEHAVNYLSPGIEIVPEDDLGGGAVHSLSPLNYWLGEDSLRHFWFNDEAARRSVSGRNPLLFDGLLYTNNCIFGVVRSYGRHRSDTYGTMRVRGSVVCADLGVLMIDQNDTNGTGFRMYYDKRVDAFLNVEDPTQVEFSRLTFRFVEPVAPEG